MTNFLSRRLSLGGYSAHLNAQQLQMDAMLNQASEQSTSGLFALAGASLLGRFVGLGCTSMGMRAGFSPLLTRSVYHASSLVTEVGVYRAFSYGAGQAFERNGFVSDLLTFGVLRGAGILGQGRNIVAVHALQSGGAVLAQNLAYQAGWLQEAPQGTILQQWIHSEFFNLKQNAAMALMHLVTGGRVLQLETLQEGRVQSLFQLSRRRAFDINRNATPLFVMKSQGEYERVENQGIANRASELSSGEAVLFQNPIMALVRPRDFSPYKMGESFEVAREGENILIARLSGVERGLKPAGHTFNYYLNGQYVGYLTHQVLTDAKEIRLIDMIISPAMQGKNLGKVIMLYHLYQAHVAGWQYTRDLITNEKLIQTANRPFEAGINMYLDDAKVQKIAATMDPWEPRVIPVGDELPLYQTDTSRLTIDPYSAYRITGTPNPAMFRSLESHQPYPYKLYFPAFTEIMNAVPGSEFVIASRQDSDIRLRIRERRVTDHKSFVRPQVPELYFDILEKNTRGALRLFLEPGELSLYYIGTRDGADINMRAGAGSIVMEWVATQAALKNWRFNVYEIGTQRVMEILLRRRLINPQDTRVEFGRWENFGYNKYDVVEEHPWRDDIHQIPVVDSDRWIHFANVRSAPPLHLLARRRGQN